MELAFIVLTTECTRVCPYCFYRTGHQNPSTSLLDVSTLSLVFHDLRTIGVTHIIFTGGEPLLRKDIYDIIVQAKRQGFFTSLLTNGEKITPDTIADLEVASLDALIISLDSLVDRTLKAPKAQVIKVTLHSSIPLSLITAVTLKNAPEVKDLHDFSRSLSIGHLFGPAYLPAGSPHFKDYSIRNLPTDKWDSLREDMQAWAEYSGMERYCELMFDFYTNGGNHNPDQCLMGTGSLVINADGTVLPCFHREDLTCGNVLRDDIGTIVRRLHAASSRIEDASCFGEHCITLFTQP